MNPIIDECVSGTMKHNMETNIAEDACWELVKIFVHQMSTY